MQILTNQLVPNSHGRNNQVSFNALHINSNIIELPQEQRAIIGQAATGLRELAKKDEVIISKEPYTNSVEVSVIRELMSALKIPVINKDSLYLTKITPPEELIAFVKAVQEDLTTEIDNYIKAFNGSDTKELSKITKNLTLSIKDAVEKKEQFPEMDKEFKEVFVDNSDSELRNLKKTYETKSGKIQEVKDFYNQITG